MVKKIMIVDDNPDVIYTIKSGIEKIDKNYHIYGVESGEECLQLLQNNQIPDLILLDIMMPQMSGWETFDNLKENPQWKNIPVVFLTARSDRVAKNAGKFLGEDYIEKPFKIQDIKNRLDTVLSQNKKNTKTN